MAVTTQYSTELGNVDNTVPVSVNEVANWDGQVQIRTFTFTQSGAGDANSLAYLVKLPAGRVRVLGALSRIQFAAFGTGRTLDVGHAAYTESDGTAVAADEDDLDAAVDVSAAGSAALGTALGAGTGDSKIFDSRSGVQIQAKVESGTIPDGTKLTGYIAFTKV